MRNIQKDYFRLTITVFIYLQAIKIVSSPSTQVKEEGGLSFDSIGCVGHSFFITTVLVQNRTVDSHHKNSFRHKPDKLVCTISDLSKDTFETCSTFYSFHSDYRDNVFKLKAMFDIIL